MGITKWLEERIYTVVPIRHLFDEGSGGGSDNEVESAATSGQIGQVAPDQPADDKFATKEK